MISIQTALVAALVALGLWVLDRIISGSRGWGQVTQKVEQLASAQSALATSVETIKQGMVTTKDLEVVASRFDTAVARVQIDMAKSFDLQYYSRREGEALERLASSIQRRIQEPPASPVI